ncbi:hypothetical protein KAU43_07490 [candidate division WOR-3 bacterium]|nr:hypothetical protein [candidate division WOR-3 bacterium]
MSKKEEEIEVDRRLHQCNKCKTGRYLAKGDSRECQCGGKLVKVVRNPENLQNGDIVIYKEDGLIYQIYQITFKYSWITARPYEHFGKTLFNKIPQDFEKVD